MTTLIKFPATIFKMATDRDGETRIQLDVPRSALEEIVPLLALTDAVLEVNVKVTKQQGRMEFGGKDEGDDE